MKKGICILIFLILISMVSYGEPIDESYINLIFDKFSDYSESVRIEKAEELKVFMEENARLDLLYTIIVTTKADVMAKYNISEADLKKNIEALKTWSTLDRLKLVEAGASGDRSTVEALNNKYTPGSNNTSTPALPPSGAIDLGDTDIPLGTTDLKQVLKAAGFLYEPLEIIEKGKTFNDVKNHWSKDFVVYLAERKIISGYDGQTYGPDDAIKKSEIVALLMKMLVVDTTKVPAYTGQIQDLNFKNWYDATMKNAYTLGIIAPNNEGLIEPNHYATREEVVDMLIKSLDALGLEIDDAMKIYQSNFKDYSEVKSELKESMTIAINLGFISGMGDNRIAPKEEITRGQIAVVMKKLYLYILDEMTEASTLNQ